MLPLLGVRALQVASTPNNADADTTGTPLFPRQSSCPGFARPRVCLSLYMSSSRITQCKQVPHFPFKNFWIKDTGDARTPSHAGKGKDASDRLGHGGGRRRPSPRMSAGRRKRCGGAAGCLLFVAAGGGRGRGDLCRCGRTGAPKATPGRTPHMRRACRCRRRRSVGPAPANPASLVHPSKWRAHPVDRW